MTTENTVAEATSTAISTEPRVINITKSKLAQFKGLGKDINYIAEYYGISTADTRKVMADAGLSKAKKPEYIINYTNDITV